jgi:hypothetical protein
MMPSEIRGLQVIVSIPVMKTITEIAESDCGSQADNEFWE